MKYNPGIQTIRLEIYITFSFSLYILERIVCRIGQYFTLLFTVIVAKDQIALWLNDELKAWFTVDRAVSIDQVYKLTYIISCYNDYSFEQTWKSKLSNVLSGWGRGGLSTSVTPNSLLASKRAFTASLSSLSTEIESLVPSLGSRRGGRLSRDAFVSMGGGSWSEGSDMNLGFSSSVGGCEIENTNMHHFKYRYRGSSSRGINSLRLQTGLNEQPMALVSELIEIWTWQRRDSLFPFSGFADKKLYINTIHYQTNLFTVNHKFIF